ncbi:MAG: hypothetical protein JWM85_3488 [Acidimicrobiaceae bacterium]|nr:hypothetical protein [Acidimicrobiaceae bacterium]
MGEGLERQTRSTPRRAHIPRNLLATKILPSRTPVRTAQNVRKSSGSVACWSPESRVLVALGAAMPFRALRYPPNALAATQVPLLSSWAQASPVVLAALATAAALALVVRRRRVELLCTKRAEQADRLAEHLLRVRDLEAELRDSSANQIARSCSLCEAEGLPRVKREGGLW